MGMARICTALVLIVLAWLATPLAASQIGYAWTFPDLFAKADVVVIGRVTAIRDTGRVVPHPSLKPALPMVEMEADVAIELLLKGGAAAPGTAPNLRSLVLKYYRRDIQGWTSPPTADGVRLGGMLNGGSTLKLEAGREPYVMFLKRDGERYEPLSGHTFPTDSVYLMSQQRGG